MHPDFVLAYFDPQEIPVGFERLLQEDGFRWLPHPPGPAVQPVDPNRVPARSLFFQTPSEPRGPGPFRALYARAQTGALSSPPEILRRLRVRSGARP